MKRFLINVVLFILIIVIGQILFVRFLAPRLPIVLGIPGIARLDTYLMKNYQFIYLGDSVIRSVAAADVDKRSIIEMLVESNPDLTMGDLTHPSYQLGIFESIVKYIAWSPHKPKAIIIPINLRSFSPSWDQQPGQDFKNEVFFLNHPLLAYFGKPLSVLRAIKPDLNNETAFLTAPVYYGTKPVGTVSDFIDPEKFKVVTEPNLKSKFILYYQGKIDNNHRKLKSLENSIARAADSGIKVYVYITPIDYQSGEAVIGPDFTRQVTENTDLICNLLKEKNTPCLNLVFGLNSDQFDYYPYPNEHLKESGRRFVADRLVDFIKN